MSHRALRLGSFYSYFLIGLFLTLVGPLIPVMREEFLLSYGEVSRIFLFQGAGFIAAVLLGGLAADRYESKGRLLVSGLLFLGASLCAFSLVEAWSAALILFLLLGLGFGLAETVLNAVFFDLSQGSEGKGLNVLHTAPAIGGIFGAPFAAALLPLGWRAPLVTLGGLLILGAAWLGLVSYPQRARSGPKDRGGLWDAAFHPVIFALGVMIASYVGVEGSVNGWTVTYSVEAFGGSTIAGSLITSLFWLGLAGGRAICGRLAAPGRYTPILVACGAAAGAAYLPVLVVPSLGSLTFTAFAIGLALGGVFPTAVAHAGTFFPNRAGVVTGYLFAWCTVGGAAIPAGVGAVADRWGMQAGMALIWAALLALVACALLVARAKANPRESHGTPDRTPGRRR